MFFFLILLMPFPMRVIENRLNFIWMDVEAFLLGEIFWRWSLQIFDFKSF